jgi:CubicO group peptidase (beta-lactamase class C family)
MRQHAPNARGQVTARHLLSQSSGLGKCEPGSCFTYDSDQYIQHLSHLLNQTAGENVTAREWATRHFAVPLGIPDLYAYQRTDPAERGDTPLPSEGGALSAISAGGDQPMRCRDMARVGQLLLNQGVWLDANGESFQLANHGFVQEMFKPQDTHITVDEPPDGARAFRLTTHCPSRGKSTSA